MYRIITDYTQIATPYGNTCYKIQKRVKFLWFSYWKTVSRQWSYAKKEIVLNNYKHESDRKRYY